MDPRAALEAHADPERAVREKAYLKSDLVFLGAGLPAVRTVAAALLKDRKPDRAALIGLVDELWAPGIHDLRALAIVLLEKRQKLLLAEDLPWLERLLRDSRTWAYVDAVAVHVVGPLVARNPDLAEALDRWSADPDFWIRRSAMLALLLDLRRGAGDLDRFFRYADAMLDEKEFFIRKAIGWILREIGYKRPEVVDGWLTPRVARMSGVTFREAVKPLPPERRAALAAARSRS